MASKKLRVSGLAAGKITIAYTWLIGTDIKTWNKVCSFPEEKVKEPVNVTDTNFKKENCFASVW